MKMKADCMNCNEKVEFELKVEKQIVICEKCKCKMQIKCFKNGKISMRNLSC